MSYRNDLEAAQARIKDLEARLRKKESTALAKIESKALKRQAKVHPLLGAPTNLIKTRTIANPVDGDMFSKMVMVLRKNFSQPGVVSEIGNSFTWSADLNTSGNNGGVNRVTLYVENSNDSAELRMEQSTKSTAAAIYGGVGAGVGFGAGPLLVILLANTMPLALIGAVPLWIGGVYATCRTLYKKSVAKKELSVDECLDALVQVVDS